VSGNMKMAQPAPYGFDLYEETSFRMEHAGSKSTLSG
jgi:hypothetical protein